MAWTSAPGARTGRSSTPSRSTVGPWCDTGPPRHSARSTSIASSVRAPRSPIGTPTAANSAGNSPPTPTPTVTRPPERESRSASCLATSTGGYSGSTRTAVPTRTRSVHATSSASRVIASPVAVGGSTWPPCHTDATGSRSTAASHPRSGSGRAAAPRVMRSAGTGSGSVVE